MRRMRTFTIVLALALAASIGAFADEHDCYVAEFGEDDEVEFCTQENFFKEAETKFSNLGRVDNELGAGVHSFPTWDEEPPAQSVTEGAGAGFLGSDGLRLLLNAAGPHNEAHGGATFEGTFDGDIDNLAVDLYFFMPFSNALGTTDHTIYLTVLVDGAPVYETTADEWDSIATSPSGDAVFLGQFALTDVHQRLRQFNMADRDSYEVTLHVQPIFIDVDNVVYVFDTTEVPSGITFNATDLDGYTLLSP